MAYCTEKKQERMKRSFSFLMFVILLLKDNFSCKYPKLHFTIKSFIIGSVSITPSFKI